MDIRVENYCNISSSYIATMNNIFNQDFKKLIGLFNEHEVEYILVGGYAVILHGYVRTTGDLDLWLNRSSKNYKKFIAASNVFGLPTSEMTKEKFLHSTEIDVFSFGRPPNALDIMLDLKGMDFKECYELSELYETDDTTVRLINYKHLIAAKKAAGRPKDLVDIIYLEEE
jgi:hypothetical protein